MNPACHQHTWHHLQSLQPPDNLHHVSLHGHGGRGWEQNGDAVFPKTSRWNWFSWSVEIAPKKLVIWMVFLLQFNLQEHFSYVSRQGYLGMAKPGKCIYQLSLEFWAWWNSVIQAFSLMFHCSIKNYANFGCGSVLSGTTGFVPWRVVPFECSLFTHSPKIWL